MADDELIIRHVRLCECGKAAGHNSLCLPTRTAAGLDPERDVQPVDDAFADVTTERAHQRFDRRRREFDSERHQQRAGMHAFDLHRWVMEHQFALSTVAGGNIEPTRGGGDPSGPPRQQLLEDDPRWREHMSVIRRRLELAAELIDEAEGHSTVASTTHMIGEEKDRLILSKENQGLSAKAVVDRLGSHIAGSPRTVQRVRREAGLDSLGSDRESGK